MAAERLSMRTIKEVLRLKWEKKFSNKQVAQSCSIARSTVREYVERAQSVGLSWPLAPDLDDSQLEALLFPPPSTNTSEKRCLPCNLGTPYWFPKITGMVSLYFIPRF